MSPTSLSFSFNNMVYLTPLHICLINLLDMSYSPLIYLSLHFNNLAFLDHISYTSLYILYSFHSLFMHHIPLLLLHLLSHLNMYLSYTVLHLSYNSHMSLLALSFNFNMSHYILTHLSHSSHMSPLLLSLSSHKMLYILIHPLNSSYMSLIYRSFSFNIAHKHLHLLDKSHNFLVFLVFSFSNTHQHPSNSLDKFLIHLPVSFHTLKKSDNY